MRNSNVSFCKTLEGIKISNKSESLFVDLTDRTGKVFLSLDLKVNLNDGSPGRRL